MNSYHHFHHTILLPDLTPREVRHPSSPGQRTSKQRHVFKGWIELSHHKRIPLFSLGLVGFSHPSRYPSSGNDVVAEDGVELLWCY
jgi:hypothetical protein